MSDRAIGRFNRKRASRFLAAVALALFAFPVWISAGGVSLALPVQQVQVAETDHRSSSIDPVAAIKRLASVVGNELSKVEGRSLSERVGWVADRVQRNPSGRIIWFIVASIAVLSVAFMIAVAVWLHYWLRVSREPLSAAVSATATKAVTDSSKSKNSPTTHSKPARPAPAGKQLSKVAISSDLETGLIDKVEAALLQAIKAKQADPCGIIYLLACCAVKCSSREYSALVNEIKELGAGEDPSFIAHAGQIGRLLAPEDFDVEDWPEPSGRHSGKSKLISSTFDSVMEFGNAQTLLDMLRTYTDMEDVGAARHLMVQILVYGDGNQRAEALGYARRLADEGKTKI